MLAGSTADRLGRRRTFQTGPVVFTAGSLLCSPAPGLGWLIAFRMVQPVGASMLNPVTMSNTTNVFTEPPERARAIGVWGGVVGISLGLGPGVGGVRIETDAFITTSGAWETLTFDFGDPSTHYIPDGPTARRPTTRPGRPSIANGPALSDAQGVDERPASPSR